MKHLCLTGFALAALSAESLAGELNLNHVSSEAHWLVHVDMEGMQRTSLWQGLRARGVLEEIELDEFQEFEREFGLHPLIDVKAMTIYGTGTDHEQAVAVVTASSRVDAAIQRLAGEDGYRRLASGDLEIHSWGEGTQSFLAYVQETGPDERVIVLADESDLLFDGIRVMKGEATNLVTGRSSRIQARPSPGSFLFVAASQGLPAMDWTETTSQVFGLAERLSLDVGEQGGQLYARVGLTAAESKDAANLYDIVNGFLAMGRMFIGHADELPPEVLDFLDALRVQRRDREVWVEFVHNSLAILETLEDLDRNF